MCEQNRASGAIKSIKRHSRAEMNKNYSQKFHWSDSIAYLSRQMKGLTKLKKAQLKFLSEELRENKVNRF
jgi:hypothetical protein